MRMSAVQNSRSYSSLLDDFNVVLVADDTVDEGEDVKLVSGKRPLVRL